MIARLDSKLVRFSQATFLKLIERNPTAALEIARLVIQRLGKQNPVTYQRIAIIPLQRELNTREVAETLAAELGRFGSSCVVGQRVPMAGDPGEGSRFDYEVYDAGHGKTEWSRHCFLEADLILFVAAAGAPCKIDEDTRLSAGIERRLLGRVDLLMLHPGQWRRDCNTSAWIKKTVPQEHHHIRTGHPGDMARLARLVAGRAINVVLGGGGGAHLRGVWRFAGAAGVGDSDRSRGRFEHGSVCGSTAGI